MVLQIIIRQRLGCRSCRFLDSIALGDTLQQFDDLIVPSQHLQGKTDPASLTPELRKMAEEAEAEARRAGDARAAQARTAARPAAAGGIPGGGRRNIVRL